MSRGSKIIHIPEKITGSKTKVLEHVIDNGLERALEVFEQLRKTRGKKSSGNAEHLRRHEHGLVGRRYEENKT